MSEVVSGHDLDASELSPEQEELLMLLLEEEELDSGAPICSDRKSDTSPLSFVQEQLWLIDRLNPGDPAYNVSVHLSLSGDLDLDALESSLAELTARHEPLRTAFEESAGRPIQRILPPRPVLLTIVDLRSLSGTAQEQVADGIEREEGRRLFDLRSGYLFRATLVLQTERFHLLLLTLHHIIFDVWSTSPLLRELALLYQAARGREESALPPAALQYRDFIQWQRARLHPRRLADLRAFWQQNLAGSPPLLALPTDRARPARQTFNGARVAFRISQDRTAALRALGRSADASLFVTALSIYKLLLSRYTGQADVVVGSPISSRHRTEFEALIGFFVDVVALRTKLEPRESFRALLARTQQSVLRALAHQDMSFPLLVDALKVPRDLSHNPIFQVSFALISQAPSFPALGDVQMHLRESHNLTSKFDITLDFFEDSDGLFGSIEYNTDLFDAATIERMAGHYRTLVDAVLADPERPVESLELLTEEERQTLLRGWNPVAPLAPERCVHAEIATQAGRTPDAPALTAGEETLTYAVLLERARSLAEELRALGVGPDVLVGVHLPRVTDLVVAVLAVLEAGGAYLPLDPSYPRERTALIVEDAAPKAILTTRQLAAGLAHPRLLFVEEERKEPPGTTSALELPATTPSHLAYVLYTSGSTGRPQGVQVEHRNVASFFAAMDELLGAPRGGVWLAVTSLSFDISVLEFLWTLSRGMHVVLQRELTVSPPVRRAAPRRDVDLSLFFFAADSGDAHGDLYDLLRRSVRHAEQLGYSAVFLPERHFHAFGGPYPSPSVIGAALSSITTRMHIRAGSVVLPLNDPLRVAEEWSLVDNLSGGRAGVSFASGWHANDFVLAPERYADRRAHMLTGIETVQRLWRGEAIRRKNGLDQEIDVRVHPRPVQAEIPVWLTAAGNIDTFRAAGERGYRVLTHLLGQGTSELGDKIAAYRRAYSEAGHSGRGHVTLMVHSFLGTDLADVRSRVRRPFMSYLRSSVDLTARLAEQMGFGGRTLSAQDLDALLEHGYERYVEHSALLGTPQSCRRLFDELCDLGVDEIAGLIDFGMPTDEVLVSLELFMELRAGAFSPAAPSESVVSQITRHGVTHLQCTPSFARLLVEDPQARAALGTLRELLIGGEELPLRLARELAEVVPGTVRNMYGPTETTVWSTSWRVPAGCDAVRIGSPLLNSRAHVLDAQGQLAPIGVTGELVIGGAGVARGYHRRPALTAQRFVPDPFVPDARVYRTGDLARVRPDGTLEFLGRRDNQIKLRGHRIELAEIESAIRASALVAEAAAMVHPDAAGEPQLCAYVIPAAAEVTQLAPQASTEHLSTWQALWDRTYSQPPAAEEDTRFWTAGWVSSYTGEAITAPAMQEWVDTTVARIRLLRPLRVLEIGCGTGLLLFRLAPLCESYLAQDFSSSAITHVRAEVERCGIRQVTLVEAAADALDHVAKESVDTVVLNSVVQYFPTADYLTTVLEQAIARVSDGGTIFIGDVRDLRLLRAQIGSVLVHRANQDSPNRSAGELQRELERRAAEEEELLLDPSFFAALRERMPRVHDIRILRKRGHHDTEMARFRHDVILHVGPAERAERAVAASIDRSWDELTLTALRPILLTARAAPLVLRDVPDARLAGPASIARALRDAGTQDAVAAALPAAALRTRAVAAEAAAIDLEEVRVIAEELGLAVEVSPPASGDEERSDVAIWDPARSSPAALWSRPTQRQASVNLASNPLRAKQLRTLVPRLREHLQRLVPDYMLPSAFVFLDALPRTPNGKIARQALPAPGRPAVDLGRAYIAPRTPTEIKLAALWSQILGIERLSAHDNFFDMGGHSFSAAQLAFHIRATFGRELPLGSLFASPTLSALAHKIESAVD
jgi:natural product biosynthesis luciferase-like monooxygenase protein